MIFLYLITLIIAPQLWLEPFIGLRTDIFIYPMWFLIILINGKINDFFDFKKLDWFFLAYICWTIFSALVNDQNELTTKIIVDYVKWFILYRLVIVTFDNIDDLIKSVHKLLFLIYIIVLEGYQHKHSADGLGWAGQPLGWVDQSVLDAGGTGRTQWVSNFDGPGVFCVMYTIALPFVLQYLDKHYSLKTKFIALIALIPLLLAIWYTGSRGGFLATIGIFGLYMTIRAAKKYGLSIVRLMQIGAMASAVLMLAPSHLTQVKDDNNSAQHRVDMWIQGVEMVQQNPVFGIGRGNFSDYTGSLIAHNSAIENMGELGLPGLFFWIAMMYISFRHLYVFYNTSDNPVHVSYANALAICLAGYLISSMFVTLEYETLYFLIALAAVFGKKNERDLEFNLNDYIFVGGICLGWVAILKIFVSIYY